MPIEAYIKHRWSQDPCRLAVLCLHLAGLLLWLGWPALLLRYPAVSGGILLLSANLLLLWRSGTHFTLIELLPLLMLAMMWVAPGIQYDLEAAGRSMSGQMMRVDPDTYFRICIPGVLAFGTGLYWRPFLIHSRRRPPPPPIRTPVLTALTLLGFAAALCVPFVPAALRFPAHLLESLLWVAMLAACWSPDRRLKWGIGIPGLLLVFFLALQTTMFGELMAGLLVFCVYLQFNKRWRMLPLLAVQIGLGLSIFFLISFKYTYRQAVQANDGNLWEKFRVWQTLGLERLRQPLAVEGLDPLLSRINQGAITSICFGYVPKVQPFVFGETIRTDLAAALIPRAFWPDKPAAGGVDNCRRFMGIENRGYSLNIGTVGEAYVNFGRYGAAWFLFAWGCFIRLVFEGLWYLSYRLRYLFFFLGMLFMPLLVPDSDLLLQLNHLLKGGIFAVGCCWALAWIERVLSSRALPPEEA